MASIPDDENIRPAAELAKLRAETELIEAQIRKTRAEMEAKLQVEIQQLIAETRKANAEASKFGRETFFYPLVVVTGSFAALLGLLKLFGLLK